uniref:Uncharacterized protein n=1 Tax=Rhizophora mucronata TaxID=61149 RepID=A0A2P2NR49_RHIMU
MIFCGLFYLILWFHSLMFDIHVFFGL